MTLYADIAGERLDAFLARSIQGMTRSAAQKLLDEAQLQVKMIMTASDGSPVEEDFQDEL